MLAPGVSEGSEAHTGLWWRPPQTVFHPRCTMTDPLGMSIGTTNLVGARVGSPPLTRRAVLTLSQGHAPQVGVPPGPPDPDAITIAGFVERVGDPIPLVAADGCQHLADRLIVEA